MTQVASCVVPPVEWVNLCQDTAGAGAGNEGGGNGEGCIEFERPGCARPFPRRWRRCIFLITPTAIDNYEYEYSPVMIPRNAPKHLRSYLAVSRQSRFPQSELPLRSLPAAMYLALGDGSTDAAPEGNGADEEAEDDGQYGHVYVCLSALRVRRRVGGRELRGC